MGAFSKVFETNNGGKKSTENQVEEDDNDTLIINYPITCLRYYRSRMNALYFNQF